NLPSSAFLKAGSGPRWAQANGASRRNETANNHSTRFIAIPLAGQSKRNASCHRVGISPGTPRCKQHPARRATLPVVPKRSRMPVIRSMRMVWDVRLVLSGCTGSDAGGPDSSTGEVGGGEHGERVDERGADGVLAGGGRLG